MKIIASGLIFHEKKVLLFQNSEGNEQWTIPSVNLKAGESFKNALERRIEENIGLKIKLGQIKTKEAFIGSLDSEEQEGNSLTVICESEIATLPRKNDKSQWVMPQDALKLNLAKSAKKVIKKYLTEQQSASYLLGWQKCKADFDNYQKKVNVLLTEAKEKTTESFLLEVIPVLSNFDLAIAHIPQVNQKDAWVEGIFHIKKQLSAILEKAGVSEIKALGEKFDPVFHECLEEVKGVPKKDRNRVVEIVEKGYCQGEKVIQATKVKVGS
ncbi:MAG: nucleotide exchange factor GrpE [Patescibacteria group bacterium]|nr:nucleotide exchange factor GrpE [Patescibacteria group bacterium]